MNTLEEPKQEQGLFTYQRLLQFATKVFLTIGCSENEAAISAKNLLIADLRGVDSHGIARLEGYVRLWESSRINVNPRLSIIHETPSTGTVDADAALGLVAGEFAMNLAIEKAKQVGSGWIAVKNSNHFGIAGNYAMMAMEHNMIGMVMTNASPLVAPAGSVSRMLGTNPIAIAIPSGSEPPYVADFATTTAANGKLEILQRKSLDAPIGWIQQPNGDATTDPHALKNGGALLPLGSDSDRSYHKGYCLGSWVDIFSGVLSGANFGPWVPPFVHFLPVPQNSVGEGIGHFFGALRIDGFQDASVFKSRMDVWLRAFRSAEPIDGVNAVLVPGDPERAFEADRILNGIALLPSVVNSLHQLAQKFKVEL